MASMVNEAIISLSNFTAIVSKRQKPFKTMGWLWGKLFKKKKQTNPEHRHFTCMMHSDTS